MSMRRRLAAVLATAVAGVALNGVQAQAVPGVPSPVFDPNSVGWLSLRDQSSAQFSSSFATNSRNGYLITDIDIEVNGRDYRVGSVWQKNIDHRGWQELRDLTSAQFHDAWVDASRRGMRLVEQETYVVSGVRLYAGIWIENVEGLAWASFRGLTSAEFSQRFSEQSRAGRMPIDIDTYVTSGELRYSVVWVQNAESLAWQEWRNLTSAQFSAKFAELKADYRMLAFDSVQTSAGQRYAGIWVENRNGRGWAVYRDLTAQGYVNRWHRFKDLGYRLVSFDRYQTANGTRYAGIWRQNSDRPDWAPRASVDSLVQSELDAKGIPGISVAVFHNGQARYLRGFGYADIDDGVWMDSEHVGMLASISKSIGGVLTMRMVEQGLVDLNDKTRDLVPQMPAHHTHTVGQLASNRGCVGDYGDFDIGSFDNMPYATALDAADEFWDEPLECTPPTPYYSTPGWTLLGAALEAAGGDDIRSLVRTKLTNPFDLGTLEPQDLNDPHVRWMTFYNNGAEIPAPDKSWTTLGGGIQSSVYDLGRFSAKLAAGQILSQNSLDTMWTAPDTASISGYGWDNVSTDPAGRPVATKSGSFPGYRTYLLIYPDEEVVVAVMMNDRSTGGNARQLAWDIGGVVVNSLP